MGRKRRRGKTKRASVRVAAAREERRERASSSQAESASRDGTSLWWLLAPIAVLLAYRGASAFEFVGDARFLIAENAYVKSASHWRETLVHDYFWSSSGQIIPYWRPFTKLSWLAEWQWFGSWAGGYAWVNVIWHALSCIGLGRLARQLGASRFLATIAAVAFALHPVAIEPVALIMARSDVVATAASIWAVVCFLAWRRATVRTQVRLWAVAHASCVVLAVASKEVAIVLPAVLASWALLEGDGRRERRRYLWTLVPSTAIAVTYYLVRRALLERVATGLSATELAIDPLRIVTGLGTYLRSGFPFAIVSGVREVPIAEAKSAFVLVQNLATLALAAAAVAWALRRRRGSLVALVGWAVVGLAPVLVTRGIAVPTAPDRYSHADRWLYYSLGPLVLAYSILGAQIGRWALARLEPKLGLRQRGIEIVLAAAVAAWAVVMLMRSGADRAELASDLAMIDNEDRVFYQGIPDRFRTHWDDCRHEQRILVKALMREKPAEALERGASAIERCPDDSDVQLYYLDALVQLRRFQEAEPFARRLVASPPRDLRNHGRLAYLAGVTFLQLGDTAAARPQLERAVRMGRASCKAFVALAEAAKARGRILEAVEHLETAYRCGGEHDASLRVAAATWLTNAKELDRARRVLDSLSGASLSPDQRNQVEALRLELGSEKPPQ